MGQCSILGQQHNSGKMCDTCLRPASDAMQIYGLWGNTRDLIWLINLAFQALLSSLPQRHNYLLPLVTEQDVLSGSTICTICLIVEQQPTTYQVACGIALKTTELAAPRHEAELALKTPLNSNQHQRQSSKLIFTTEPRNPQVPIFSHQTPLAEGLPISFANPNTSAFPSTNTSKSN